ncbi:GNAT family N-acetyltransferase [Priestia megaterium]|uniref:GNAT family N-acetyltransferase n=1 Tax=Priestia megaterium TaxID=1404 RepID=UPI002D7E8409|nr:GNAT family N-acetyltransferase [Priestia megaterium]MEB4887685.1 GNAT family N-acetyltransferase [Priestia megaterium]
MESIVIKPVSQQDVSNLIPLMREYIVDFYKRDQPSKESLTTHIELLLNNPSIGLQYVAEYKGNLVGFATLYFSFSTLSLQKNAVLNDLYVIPDCRSKKVGERLFETCLNHIKEYNYAGMTWETAHDNKVAQGLYDKMGGQKSQWLHYEINA